jgi:hypothetical protein
MIASFFQRLESAKVAYLLISGQATILYGAATFSEDVDLWIMPSPDNIERFVGVLRSVSATYYKLTPPFDREYALRGHGFHFVLRDDDGRGEVYLDVMGKPPRVGNFEAAAADARTFDTDFGWVRTVGIKELVELKKTQRPGDYPVISRLVTAFLDDVGPSPTAIDLRWALDNTFGVRELHALLRQHGSAYREMASTLPEIVNRALTELERAEEFVPAFEDELDLWLEMRSAALRGADRRYWREIIAELRELRSRGELMKEGALV